MAVSLDFEFEHVVRLGESCLLMLFRRDVATTLYHEVLDVRANWTVGTFFPPIGEEHELQRISFANQIAARAEEAGEFIQACVALRAWRTRQNVDLSVSVSGARPRASGFDAHRGLSGRGITVDEEGDGSRV